MRSRLEARWASMFDTLRWQWEYEPDLQAGFVIPDFALVNFAHPVLIECKPALTIKELTMHRRRLIGKLREWLRDDIYTEIHRHELNAIGGEELQTLYDDLMLVGYGDNPRGHSRRVIVVGPALHIDHDVVTVDGTHGFCLCCDEGEPSHVGLTCAIGEHCLLCGLIATAWVPGDTIMNAWRESQNDVQWQPS